MGLKEDILACTRCPLAGKQEPNTSHVPALIGRDYSSGGIAVLCEAPGYYEAQTGEPLKGKAGTMFNTLATEAGLPRESLMLTNSVRCRPPNNNIKDNPEAVFACDHWTQLEMKAYDPRIIVLMGATAIKQVYGDKIKVGTIRGTFASLPTKHGWGNRVCLCTYHPMAAVYGGGANSDVARLIIQDLTTARKMWETLRDKGKQLSV